MPETSDFILSLNSETEPPSAMLTLGALNEALKERGIDISLSTLSEYISTGDVARQLGAGGDGSRRQFHPSVAPIFAEFYRVFKAGNGKKPQMPAMLKNFLKGHIVGSGERVPSANALVLDNSEILKPEQVAAVQGRAQGLAMTEKVLTAKEAADVLHISTRMLRRTVKPFRRFGESANGDRWLLSDLLSAE